MSRKIIFARAAAIFLLSAAPASGQTGEVTSTSRERQSVNVTVYNSNIALVRETRLITLPTGRVALRFSNVAAQIRPETVQLTSLTAAGSLRILDQNYQYDLLNPNKLLDKYVGREVTLVLSRLENSSESLTPVKATLLSNNDGQVWRINNQIVINPRISETRFPDVPANLVATPTLVWEVENESAYAQILEATYLTSGLNWRADYVLVLDAHDTRGDLQAWVTLTNASGVAFEKARLQLVAGNLNRLAPRDEEMRPSGTPTAAAMVVPGFREEAFFEYHLYTLQRPASIRERETKQVSLLESAGLSVTKEFVISGQPTYYLGFNNPGQSIREDVGVYIQFRNSQEHNLGVPCRQVPFACTRKMSRVGNNSSAKVKSPTRRKTRTSV